MTTNLERAFAERPETYAAWVELNTAIKARMDLRRYELATLAAARRLRSSYCCLAHGTILQERFGEPVLAIARDHREAGLSEVDVAVMDFAERDRRRRDVDRGRRPAATARSRALRRRRHGRRARGVRPAASSRTTLDALGVLADASYRDLEPELREALIVGRPIADA